MDSTFLGILVRVALNIRKNSAGGAMVLLNLSGRNLETVRNLGIHQITEVSSHSVSEFDETAFLDQNLGNSQASSETILQAHKSLMKLNQRNHKVFADVVNFLEQNKGD